MKFGTRWPPVPVGHHRTQNLAGICCCGRGTGEGAMTRLVAWVQTAVPSGDRGECLFRKGFAERCLPPQRRR